MRNSNNRRTVKSILLIKTFLGLVKMTSELVNAGFRLPKWQAVKWFSLHPENLRFLSHFRSKVRRHGPMDSVSTQPCTLARLSDNFYPLWCPCVVSNVRKTVFHWLNHHFNRWPLWKWLKEVFTVDTIALSTTFAKGTQFCTVT